MVDKNRVAALVAEFLGTGLIVLALYSILTRTSFPLFSGLAVGAVIAVMTLVVGQFSGAHLNPAVTVGLWSARKVETGKAIAYVAAQFLGAVAAWALLQYFIGRSLTNVANADFSWKIFIAEGVGTAVFLFGLSAAVFNKFEPAKWATVGLLAFTVGVLVASMGSNGILNPAAALGVQSWSWAYAIAPLVGGIVGVNVYGYLFAPAGSYGWAMPAKVKKSATTAAKKKPAAKKKR